MPMKVKVINGNLIFGGQVYTRWACLEVTPEQMVSLSSFVVECDCGCWEAPMKSNLMTQEVKSVKKWKKKKKDCKTC